ncbi:MAG: WD40 repeat domain-containing protein [Pseudonocardiaceae bacterium]
MLGSIDPPAALGATLASRVHGVPALQAALDSYRGVLPRPRLEPAWPLPDQPDLAQLATPTGHTGGVWGCAFSPTGILLATTSGDGTVRLWRVRDGTQQAVLTGHTGGVWGCAFSPDGALLATASDDRTVRLWQVSDGTEHAILTGHESWVEWCAFSPDGTLLATASNDQTVRVWQVASGRCHCALRLASPVVGISWHPEATTLCTVGGAGIYLLNYLP